MATSGSFNTNAYSASDGSRYLTFSWSQTSQSIENNSTTFSWTLKGGGTSKQWIYAGSFKVVINGHTVYNYTGNRIQLSNGTVVASGNYTRYHNDNGTANFTASVEGAIYTYAVNCTGSGTFALNTIARASQPSCITWPEHTQKVGNFGDTISIHMNRKSDTFTHTVRYAFGSVTGTIATKVGTGTTWTIPKSLMDKIPTNTSGSGTIYVDTYNGSTKVGTKSCGFTATVPNTEECKPKVSMTLEDIAGIDDIYGSPVKGLSKIKVTVTATPAYSSPIKTYAVSINGVKYTASEATTGILTAAGDSPVTASVTDNRGRSNSTSYTMKVQDYSPPVITNLAAVRCNQDGTTNKRGAYIKVTFSASVSPMSNKNTATYTLQYKKTSVTSWTDLTTDVNGKKLVDLNDNFAPANQSFIFSAAVGNSYDIMVTATDRHQFDSDSTKAPTAMSIFSWRGFKKTDGTVEDGAGIGKVPEKPNTLQVGWDAEFEEEVYYKGKTLLDFFYPVGSIYIAYNHTNPGTLFGGTWVRIENAFLWGVDEKGTIGQTGGEKTHTLTTNEMPNHHHGSVYSGTSGVVGEDYKYAWYLTSGNKMAYGTISTGGGAAHNNMPPYTQVSIWRRTG